MRKMISAVLVLAVFALFTIGCASYGSGVPDPDRIVPRREVLIENLNDQGYTVETLSAIEGSDLTVDRIFARIGDRFLDIVYGLSSEDAQTVFEAYCRLYPDDYYILARNGNYVYCVSDKHTFSKAGFTSTDNIGTQYIHD